MVPNLIFRKCENFYFWAKWNFKTSVGPILKFLQNEFCYKSFTFSKQKLLYYPSYFQKFREKKDGVEIQLCSQLAFSLNSRPKFILPSFSSQNFLLFSTTTLLSLSLSSLHTKSLLQLDELRPLSSSSLHETLWTPTIIKWICLRNECLKRQREVRTRKGITHQLLMLIFIHFSFIWVRFSS